MITITLPENNSITNDIAFLNDEDENILSIGSELGLDITPTQYNNFQNNHYFIPYYNEYKYLVYQYIKSSDNNGNVISSELQYINFSDWQSKGQDLNSKIIGNFYEVKPYKITTEGANLISNGTFDTNITGWSRLPSTAAIAWVSSVGLDGGLLNLLAVTPLCLIKPFNFKGFLYTDWQNLRNKIQRHF